MWFIIAFCLHYIIGWWRCWHLWLGGLLLLVYIAILSAINVYSLSSGFEDDLERTAEAILAVTDLSEVSAQRVAQLQSAHEVAELFRALSTHHLSVEPRGSFAGASVPVGVTSLAGLVGVLQAVQREH